VSVSDINAKIGIKYFLYNSNSCTFRLDVSNYSLNAHEIAKLLRKMCLEAKPSSDTKSLRVTIPPTRHDILHVCDVIEDVAVAYGFNNLKLIRPPTSTIGGQTGLNKLTDLLRHEIAQAGFTEVLTFSLVCLYLHVKWNINAI